MKKERFVLLIILCLILIGCSKLEITLNEFIEVATFNGYIIREDKTGYESYSQVKSVNYAINRENAYYIQFLELETDDYAHKFSLYNVDEMNKNITSNDYKKTKSSSSYELYHAENDTTYYLIIRSKTNIIYIEAPINYINEIEEFLSELNLEY